ncbi:hypothetical protein F4818DRAFT_408264 [Hypoxylon cercidicola]|nr:hypothetical protein F4818DRAFT_408264 [Hypoxylon cercidicola]
MASLRAVLFALALVALAAATQNLTTYVPACAQACVADSVSGTCSGPDDAECLCDNIRTIGPGQLRSCVTTGCPGNSTAIDATRNGYGDYCSDAGFPTWNGWGGGWQPTSGQWGGDSQTSTTMVTSTSTGTGASATSTSSAAPTGTLAATDSEESGGDGGGSDLSKGAIAGIAIGGVIGCVLITGSLLFLAFRLGKRYAKRKREGGASQPEQDDTDPQKEGVEASRRQSKALLDGNPISELHAGVEIPGIDPIKELPTHERPVELSADPIERYDNPVLPQLPWR